MHSHLRVHEQQQCAPHTAVRMCTCLQLWLRAAFIACLLPHANHSHARRMQHAGAASRVFKLSKHLRIAAACAACGHACAMCALHACHGVRCIHCTCSAARAARCHIALCMHAQRCRARAPHHACHAALSFVQLIGFSARCNVRECQRLFDPLRTTLHAWTRTCMCMAWRTPCVPRADAHDDAGACVHAHVHMWRSCA